MAVIGLVVVRFLSDRTMRRRRYIVESVVVLGVGLIVAAAVYGVSLPLSLALFILAGLGLYAYLDPFWSAVSQLLPRGGAYAGISSG